MKFTDIRIQYLKWYDHLWLWLLRTHMIMDGGNILFWKFWKGKIYILDFWEGKK